MGWQEVLVIVVLAVLFVRPKDMPALLHRVGRFVGGLRDFWKDTMEDVDRTQHNISVLEKERRDKGE